MKKQKNGHFFSPTHGHVEEKVMIDDIATFVSSDPDGFYRLVIGTDSQAKSTHGAGQTDFITAIIIYRIGKGARYYWKREKLGKVPVLREKIYLETTKSLDIAHNLVPSLRQAITPAKYDLEIHIDVGSLGPTRSMIKEVVGMVNGNGFTAKTKPQAWGASSVADKHT